MEDATRSAAVAGSWPVGRDPKSALARRSATDSVVAPGAPGPAGEGERDPFPGAMTARFRRLVRFALGVPYADQEGPMMAQCIAQISNKGQG